MMFVLYAPLAALAVYLTVHVLYQLTLFVSNVFVPDPPAFVPSRLRRFVVLVPAHNEELHLPRLLQALVQQNHPRHLTTVTVIADNCSDGTAAAARAAGVDVLERTDPDNRGKGHALAWALRRIDLSAVDAVVIVDSDSVVDPTFIEELNLQMERGDVAIQCYNALANPSQTWFTRLLHVSRTISNELLHPGLTKIGLSATLMGNGMCFDARLLQQMGWGALTIAEDWEYYVRLSRAGVPIGYSRGARVYHQESLNLKQASSQRLRWSSGWFHILRQHGTALIAEGLRTRNVRMVGAALPLALPNPSLAMNLSLMGLVLSSAAWLAGGRLVFAGWFLTIALLQVGMFMVGVLLTREKAANAAALFMAPVFLVWKISIDIMSVCGLAPTTWKPTERRQ